MNLKIFIIFGFFLYLWFGIANFIQIIYNKYANNIFELCVIPLITVFLMKIFITFNLLMLKTTLILYYFGQRFMRRRRPSFVGRIAKLLFVNDIAFIHYQAIDIYLTMIEKSKNFRNKHMIC